MRPHRCAGRVDPWDVRLGAHVRALGPVYRQTVTGCGVPWCGRSAFSARMFVLAFHLLVILLFGLGMAVGMAFNATVRP